MDQWGGSSKEAGVRGEHSRVSFRVSFSLLAFSLNCRGFLLFSCSGRYKVGESMVSKVSMVSKAGIS